MGGSYRLAYNTLIMNILTIDLDFIMSPCIDLYNTETVYYIPGEMSWMANNVNERDVKISKKNLKYISNIIKESINFLKFEQISFTISHDGILYPLEVLANEKNPFNIINIDHHHDIFYSQQDVGTIEYLNMATPSAWILYLDKYRLIKEYTWIANKNSTEFKEIDIPSRPRNFNFVMNTKNPTIDLENIEHLNITMSPQWLHPLFYKLFWDFVNLIQNYYKKEVKIINQAYCAKTIIK